MKKRLMRAFALWLALAMCLCTAPVMASEEAVEETAVVQEAAVAETAEEAAETVPDVAAEEAAETTEETAEAAPDETEEPVVIEGKTFPYIQSFSDEEEPVMGEMTLYFVNGGDIPYVTLSEYMPFLSNVLADLNVGDISYEVTNPDDDPRGFSATRPDNASMLYVNTAIDTMTFSEYNNFTQPADVTALVAVLDLPDEDLESDFSFVLPEDPFSEAPADDAEENPDAADATEDISDSDADSEADADAEADEENPDPAAPADDAAPAEDTPAEDAPTEEPDEFDIEDWQEELQNVDTLDEADAILDNYFYSDVPLIRVTRKSINRSGGLTTVNLSNYNIDMYDQDGECYIPLATLNDLLLGPEYVHVVFTGEKVICAGYDCALLDKMYEAEPEEMSEEFAEFNYNETLLLLDCFYGLKEEHAIQDFATFLNLNTDLGYKMRETDPGSFDSAIISLTGTYFDDLHSGFLMPSWRSGNDGFWLFELLFNMGPSSSSSFYADSLFSEAREAVFRKWVPGYEEVGDTAFVTFDSFTANHEDLEEYYTDYFEGVPDDTIHLISYAHNEITREDSPVKNVVVDLSNNSGGDATAAVFVIAWLLGDATIALKDTFTGAETIMNYEADVNMNHKFNPDEDSLTGKDLHVYLMTSPLSFSCGNLVPAACKGSNRVTIIGQASTGGSCCVLPVTSPSGTIYQISGNLQLSTVRNGSFYNIDRGIEPDVMLTKPETFYDRPALVEFLHDLK